MMELELTKRNPYKITFFIWKVNTAIRVCTIFCFIWANITALCEQITTNLTALVCIQHIGICNHAETGWECLGPGQDAHIPAIIGGGIKAIDAGVCLGSIGVCGFFVDARVLYGREEGGLSLVILTSPEKCKQ